MISKRLHRKTYQPFDPTPDSLKVFAFVVTSLLGFVCGWYSGTSSASISATIVPLFFGAIAGLVWTAQRIVALRLVAICVFTVSFIGGLNRGQHVDRPVTTQQLIDYLNVNISDATFEELTLLEISMQSKGIDASRHNQVMYSVASNIFDDDKLAHDERILKLRSFRERLDECCK